MKINQVKVNNLPIYNKNKTSKSDNFSKIINDLTDNSLDEEKEKKKLKNAATEFESYFLNMMFKSMKKTIVPAIEKSNAEKTFEEMLDQKICDNIAKSGGIGFGNMIYNTLENR